MKIELDEPEVVTFVVCTLIFLIIFLARGCDINHTNLEHQLFIATNTPAMKN